MSINRSKDHEDRQGNQAVNGSTDPAPNSGDARATVPKGQATPTGGQDRPQASEGQRLVVGEIVGWRYWRPMLVGWPFISERFAELLHPPRLASVVHHGYIWYPEKLVLGPALFQGVCGGIYAFKNHSVATHEVTDFAVSRNFPILRPSALVGGGVYLWGEVAEHEDGYRAEYAAIKSLDWAGPFAHLPVEEWAAIYGVPCNPVPNM